MSTTEAPRPTEHEVDMDLHVVDRPTVSRHGRAGRHAALEMLASGYLLLDAEGIIVDVNATAAELLGRSRERLLGASAVDAGSDAVDESGALVSPGDLPATVTLRTREPVDGRQLGVRRGGGELVWLRVSSRLLRPDDPTSECVVVFDDVTERRALDRALRTVQAVDETLIRASSAGELMSDVCRAVVEGGDYRLAWIGVGSADDQEVEIVAAHGAIDYLYEGIVSSSEREARGRGPMGAALRNSISVTIDDIATDPVFTPWRERALEHGFASVGTFPFRIDGRPAALAVYAPVGRAFDRDAHALLAGLVSRLEHGLVHLERTDRLRASLEATIATINDLTVARDPYTAGHHERVAELSVAIGRELGLGPAMVDGLRLGALVHDIGKIGLPAEILSRPGKLDAVEYELVKRHAELGGRILADGRLPWPVPQIAAQHHERCDGTGYPGGLVRDEIELPARIVAVADVVEAVAHHRPYRAGLGLDAALRIVRDGSGSGFDADVVEACERVFADGFRFSTDEELAAATTRAGQLYGHG